MLTLDLGRIVADHGHEVLAGTTDADETSEAVTRFGLRPHRITPWARAARLNASLSVIAPRPSMAFTRIRYAAAVTIDPLSSDDDSFMLPLVLEGKAQFCYGGVNVVPTPGTTTFIPPYRSFRSELSEDFDQMVAVFNRPLVERVASTLLDSEIDELEFDYNTDLVAFPSEAVMTFAAGALTAASTQPVLSPRGRRLMDETVLEIALLSMPSFRRRLESGAATNSRSVAKAMEYMAAHLRDPISLTDIATRVGVSPRALQLAFNRDTGLSPIQWLKRRRLERARHLLRDPAFAHVRVTDIAHECGFFHLGDFGRYFTAAFGQTPSAYRRSAKIMAAGEADSPGALLNVD